MTNLIAPNTNITFYFENFKTSINVLSIYPFFSTLIIKLDKKELNKIGSNRNQIRSLYFVDKEGKETSIFTKFTIAHQVEIESNIFKLVLERKLSNKEKNNYY